MRGIRTGAGAAAGAARLPPADARPGERPVRGRALAVGDAAGLIDPFSGDGIYEALVSARLAAEAALDVLAGRAGDLEPYAARLARELDPLASAGWAAKIAFDRYPRLSYGVARTAPAWHLAEHMLRGEQRDRRDAPPREGA